MIQQHFLQAHVYLCIRDDCAVLFDTKRGKYFTLDGAKASRLAPYVAGWPIGSAGPAGEAGIDRTIARLASAGLLTDAEHLGKIVTPLSLHKPATCFQIFELERAFRPNLRYLGGFLVACARAKWHFTNLRMTRQVRRIHARRARSAVNPSADVELLHRLVKAHYHLRPLVYSAAQACLFDSLVLLEFLALHGIDASWVFGVRTSPFAAHCWIQSGGRVLNDMPESVLQYTPIFAV